jgi:hypothetical protein
MNIYDAQVEAKLQQIAQKEAELQNAINTRNAEKQREQAWGAAGQYNTPQYREASAAYNAALLLVDRLNKELADLRTALESLRQLQAQVNTAAAAAIAAGLTPEAAYLKAEGQVEQTKLINQILKWTAIGLGIAAVVYGVSVLLRWRKNRK